MISVLPPQARQPEAIGGGAGGGGVVGEVGEGVEEEEEAPVLGVVVASGEMGCNMSGRVGQRR